MKLAFIFDTAFSYFSGHYYSVNLTEELWKNRYLQAFDEIVVIGRSVTEDSDPTGNLVRSDFERVSFRCMENTSRLKRIFRQREESRFLKEAIADCDAVICRNWWGVKECRALGKIYMMEVISCAWDIMWYHSILGKLVSIPNFLLQRKAIRNAPYVLYVTQEFLQKRYPTKGIRIGLTDTDLPLMPGTDILENRLNRIQTNNGPIVLGTLGAVNVSYKGQKHVIKALALLSKKGFTNYVYQIVGSGDQSTLRKYAEKLGVSNQVEFLGALPHEKVFEWLDRINIYVQPSSAEGLSRAIVEAMSRGLPCIVSDAGGNPELIESEFVCGRKGYFAKKLADAILKMDTQTSLACAARNYYFAQNFCAKSVNAQRVQFLKRFISGK